MIGTNWHFACPWPPPVARLHTVGIAPNTSRQGIFRSSDQLWPMNMLYKKQGDMIPMPCVEGNTTGLPSPHVQLAFIHCEACHILKDCFCSFLYNFPSPTVIEIIL